ncbi:MAG: hypothetical protein EXR98_21255 [Gemmataceae bacterium]|nr:hypothetical protein [Gemmataceae bacterium]
MPRWPIANQPVRNLPQATPWQVPANHQLMPLPAYLATGVNPQPTKARGVSAEPVSAKFVLPSPESLGVTAHLQPAAPVVDWNAIQARMDRLGVLRYQKDHLPAGGVRVMLLLPTIDRTKAQPVEAQAETEAAAIALALGAGEAWMQKK